MRDLAPPKLCASGHGARPVATPKRPPAVPTIAAGGATIAAKRRVASSNAAAKQQERLERERIKRDETGGSDRA